jgi:hypothetical protein
MDRAAADLGAVPRRQGHDVEQVRGSKTVTILARRQYKTGDVMYPDTESKK